MNYFIKSYRKYFIYAFFFSMFINILQLTFSIYMLHVYDRVLTSYNLPTLWIITLAAIIALIVLALLDWIRSRLLIRFSVDIDENLSDLVFSNNILQYANNSLSSDTSSINDIQLLRNYIGSNAINSCFDIPWMPLYFILIFILHHILGIVALMGCITVIFLGLIQHNLNRNSIKSMEHINTQSLIFTNSVFANAETVKSMGMIGAVVSRRKNINDTVVMLQANVSTTSHLIHSISKSIRLSMQVFIYAAGAYLTIVHESTPGIMIAASIVMGRALGPIDQAMSTYKQSLEAKEAYRRLKK